MFDDMMEEGEEEMGEDEYEQMRQQQMQEGSESGEQEENDDEFQSDPEQPNAGGDLESIDSDGDEVGDDIDTNIEGKREKAISDLLKKEDLGLIQMRLKENVKILSNFNELRDKDKARHEYLDEVKTDICSAFDYNPSLVEVIFNLFAPSEALEFIEANENQRPLTIRTNTLKTKRKDLAKVLI